VTDLVSTPFPASATAADVLADVDLHGRRYLVTGGGSGIGAETALALAGAGAEVVVGVRDPARATATLERTGRTADRVHARPLDLADLASVRRFTDAWADDRVGPLHGVVANAGVMALPDRQLSAVGWEMQLATNHLGHLALLIGLRDAVIEAGDGRVVTVSSTAHLRSPFHFEDPQFDERPYDRWAAYAQSKTADVLLAVGVAERWAADGVTANSLMPGWITTDLQRHLDDDTLRAMGAMDEAGNRIEQPFYKTPAQGAATSTLLVASPLVSGVTGRYFEDNQEAQVLDDGTGHDRGVARYALDRGDADRLWELGASVL
jgi:NAD(P)-dependent dehydrogenase (short-subunit alcohol dehydrogenase family)